MLSLLSTLLMHALIFYSYSWFYNVFGINDYIQSFDDPPPPLSSSSSKISKITHWKLLKHKIAACHAILLHVWFKSCLWNTVIDMPSQIIHSGYFYVLFAERFLLLPYSISFSLVLYYVFSCILDCLFIESNFQIYIYGNFGCID